MKKIIVIHAAKVSMQPIASAFEQDWNTANVLNILDETLFDQLAKQGHLTADIVAHMEDIFNYSVSIEADAILLACSAFIATVDELAPKMPIPVLKPNEAMFKEALALGNHIALLASDINAVAGLEQEFYALAKSLNPNATLTTVCSKAARAALDQGDIAQHNQITAQAALPLSDCDAIMLAHFSSSTAYEAVSEAVSIPVLTSPNSAVKALKQQTQ